MSRFNSKAPKYNIFARFLSVFLCFMLLCCGTLPNFYAADVIQHNSDGGITVTNKDGSVAHYPSELVDAMLSSGLLGSRGLELLTDSPFSDVKTTDWFFPFVMLLHMKGVVKGVENDRFYASGTVTAGEFLAVAAQLICPEKIDTRSAGEHWAYPYFDALKSVSAPGVEDYCGWMRSPNADVLTPSGLHKKGLSSVVTRSEMAAVIVNLAQQKGEKLNALANIENNLSDSALCSFEVLECYSAGILSGRGDSSFDPDGSMTRGEMSSVFCRLMGYAPRSKVIVQAEKKSDYIITAQSYDKGKVKYEYAQGLALFALSKMYVGVDLAGVYLSATAPQLPSELSDCTLEFTAMPYDNNGTPLADKTSLSLHSGEGRRIHLKSSLQAPLESSQIAFMEVSVSIVRPKFGASVTYTADTTAADSVVEVRYHNRLDDERDSIRYDVSHIFRAISR